MAKFTDTKGKYLQAQSKKTRKDKSNELKESIGSLDRRVQKALSSGDTDQAKDLRSRQNKFTSKLGYNEAIRTGGVLRHGPDGKIIRSTRTGQPIMTGTGHETFREAKDKYYIDPTRNLQNTNPKAYAKMYPFANAMQRGPMVTQGLKSLFEKKELPIPYASPETQGLPGAEFPLGYAEALGTPEAYNLGNGIFDGTAPINVNAAGLDLSDGYQVMDAGSDTGMDFLDYFNLRDQLPNDGYDVAELTEDQMNLMTPGLNQPDLPGGLNKEQLWNKVKENEYGGRSGIFGIGAIPPQVPTTQEEFDDYYNKLLQGEGGHWVT